MKTFKVYALGCKVNQYDAQSIRERFIEAGFTENINGTQADLCIINTCTVTHKADAESLYYIRRARKENPNAKVVVTGCLAELDRDKIKNTDGRCLIAGSQDKDRILQRLSVSGKRAHGLISSPAKRGISDFKGHTRAFLKIQDGCDNFCSYCKVPLVRGRSRSKPLKDALAEAKRLANNGFKEIVLCGICLGAYGKDGRDKHRLVELIEKLESIEGLVRIRLSSIEALDVSAKLIEKMATSDKLCPHMHIPLQSGDNEILKRMNRRYNREEFLLLINKVKERIPQFAITTDVLVGFPGESDSNFENTLGLIRQIKPLKVHIFPYSNRIDTSAARFFKEGISRAEMNTRILQLRRLSDMCSRDYRKRFLGKKMEVLVEGACVNKPGFWQGYARNYMKILIKTRANLQNQLIQIRTATVSKDVVYGIRAQ